MELWQMDVVGRIYLAGGSELSAVTGIDDHSRFCVIAKLVRRATARPLCDALAAGLRVAQQHAAFALASATLAGFVKMSSGDNARARDLLAWVFATGQDPGTHAFMTKYVLAHMVLTVVPGVTAELGPDRNGVGLALAELH
jgi:hypothetical protein